MPQQNKSKQLWPEWKMPYSLRHSTHQPGWWCCLDSALREITGNWLWHLKATCYARIVFYFTLLDKDVSSQAPVPLPLLLQQGLFRSLAAEPNINSSLSCLWSWDFSTGTEKQLIHTSTADSVETHTFSKISHEFLHLLLPQFLANQDRSTTNLVMIRKRNNRCTDAKNHWRMNLTVGVCGTISYFFLL